MAYNTGSPYYRSPFGDTTLTKVFVGGLAWETPTEEMRKYFEQFGDILEAVIITDKATGKSKGYGFVTFRDPESARRACVEPNPVIGGRRANCNIASLGRPRPSPPRGRSQGGSSGMYAGGSSTYSGVGGPLAPSPSTVFYPPYGYTTYPPGYGYHQALYNQQLQQAQYYQQLYGSIASSTPPYNYYGYSMQLQAAAASPRGSLFSASLPQRFEAAGPSNYFFYPSQLDTTNLPIQRPTTALNPHSSVDSEGHQETEGGGSNTSENTQSKETS